MIIKQYKDLFTAPAILSTQLATLDGNYASCNTSGTYRMEHEGLYFPLLAELYIVYCRSADIWLNGRATLIYSLATQHSRNRTPLTTLSLIFQAHNNNFTAQHTIRTLIKALRLCTIIKSE
jgi:hypothetical protein